MKVEVVDQSPPTHSRQIDGPVLLDESESPVPKTLSPEQVKTSGVDRKTMFIRLRLYGVYLRVAVYLSSVLAIGIATALTAKISRYHLRGFEPDKFFQLVIFTTVIWGIVAEAYQFYDIQELLRENTGFRRAAGACAITYSILLLIIFLTEHEGVSRMLILLSASLLFLLTVAHRSIARLILTHTRKRRENRVLVIGADRYARWAALQLARVKLSSTVVVGYLPLEEQDIVVPVEKIYSAEDLRTFRADGSIDEILVAVPLTSIGRATELMPDLQRLCVPIRVVVDVGRDLKISDRLFSIGNLQILSLESIPGESIRYLLLKRMFDVAFSVVMLTMTAPLLLLIAAMIKLTSPGPVFFVQDRVGLNGHVFRMYKFRTMKVAPKSTSDEQWTTSNDPRRTWLGSMLRKTSLDELPQFVNVLKGEMSVVGPRPERPHFVRRFDDEYETYNQRHRLKVGITGWAQVNGYRGDTSIEGRIQHDLYYLQNWTFALDLRIVFRTIFSGLVNKNAY